MFTVPNSSSLITIELPVKVHTTTFTRFDETTKKEKTDAMVFLGATNTGETNLHFIVMKCRTIIRLKKTASFKAPQLTF